MSSALNIPKSGALDFLSLGALVHRLDPGIIPFRKGYCLKMLGKRDEAMKEYKLCFDKYKNTPELAPDKKNPVWELSILEMGSLEQMSENYENAAKLRDELKRLDEPAS